MHGNFGWSTTFHDLVNFTPQHIKIKRTLNSPRWRRPCVECKIIYSHNRLLWHGYCCQQKRYWTDRKKMPKTSKFYSGRRYTVPINSLFHIFLNSWLYFWRIVSARRLHARVSRDVSHRGGCRVLLLAFLHLSFTSPFHEGAKTCPTL